MQHGSDAGAEQAARLHERALELHRLLEGRRAECCRSPSSRSRRIAATCFGGVRDTARRARAGRTGTRLGDDSSNTSSVDVIATLCATISLNVRCTSGLLMSSAPYSIVSLALRTDVGLLAAVYSVFVSSPCSSWSMPKRDGFAEADRAEMRGHLHAVLVRFVDRGAEIGARDLRVRLEPRHALLGPVAHHAARVVRAGERMHRARPDARALQIRAGDDDARARR